jgi:hypothetical protein
MAQKCRLFFAGDWSHMRMTELYAPLLWLADHAPPTADLSPVLSLMGKVASQGMDWTSWILSPSFQNLTTKDPGNLCGAREEMAQKDFFWGDISHEQLDNLPRQAWDKHGKAHSKRKCCWCFRATGPVFYEQLMVHGVDIGTSLMQQARQRVFLRAILY